MKKTTLFIKLLPCLIDSSSPIIYRRGFLYFASFSFLFLVSPSALAQIFSNRVADPLSGDAKIISDSSSKKKKLDDKISIFTFVGHISERHSIDTGIIELHRNKWLPLWYQDIGNLGLSAQNRWYNPLQDIAVDMGFQGVRPYFFSANNSPYFQTTRPFTEMYYRLGSQQEQALELFHTQNIHERWNVAIRYAKIGSPGFYKLQKSNNDHLAITSHYRSKNGRYAAKGQFFYNKLQQDDNGGVLDMSLFGEPAYRNKRLMPVHASNIGGRQNQSSIKNYSRQWDFNFEQTYFFKQQSISDSTHPSGISLKQVLYTQQALYRYRDNLPDTSFYVPLNINAFNVGDSLFMQYRLRRTGTAFYLQGAWKMFGQNWHINGGWGIEQDAPENTNFSPTFTNTYIGGDLQNDTARKDAWMWRAKFKQYLSGNTAGNVLLDVGLGKTWKGHNVNIFAKQIVQTAPYTFTHFASNYHVFAGNWKKTSHTLLGGEYRNLPLSLKLGLQYQLLGNYLYRDANWEVQQEDKVFSLWQASISHRLQIKNWFWENDGAFQLLDDSAPLKLPTVLWRSNVSYRRFIFKNKLQIATGLEATWHSPFYANQYISYFNDFVLQEQQQIKNKPRLTAYVQLKVKRFRGSFSLSDAQQFVVPNAILYPNYGAPNSAFHFAFYWGFVN